MVRSLRNAFGLDLANAFARNGKLFPHLFERIVGLLSDPESHAQDLFLARGVRVASTLRVCSPQYLV